MKTIGLLGGTSWPSTIVECNNTLHKAFDAIAAELALSIPVFHIVKAAGRAARDRSDGDEALRQARRAFGLCGISQADLRLAR